MADEFFEVFKKPNGKFSYHLKTRHDKILARGRQYPTKEAAKGAVEELKTVARDAPVQDRPDA